MAIKDSSYLGTSSIPSLMIQLSWPAVVSLFINMLYNLVDRIYIGNGVGTDALAGLALTSPLMILIAAFGMMAGVGTSTLISISLGQKKKEDAECALGQLLILCLLSIITMQFLQLYFLDDLLVIFGGNKATIPYARDYLRIILWGSIFQHLSFSLSAQMRAEGNAKKGMYTILIGAVTNIILDPIFIFVFKMGIKGAAIATILSMMAGSAYVLWHFIGGLGTLRLRWCNLRPHPKMLVRIVSIGMAPCCIQIASCAINIFANRCFNTCSATPELANQGIACWSIVTTLQFVFITPIFGLAQGIQPIVGFNTGAQNWLRVRKTYQTALITGLILSGCGAIIVSVSAPYLVRCFTNNDAIISMGSHGLRVLMVTFTLIAVDILNVHYFQSVGKAFISLLLSLQRQLIFFLPSILLLSHFAGIEYIWWSLPIADVVAFMVSGNIAVQVLRRLKKKGQESISISVSGLSENPAEGKK